MSVLRRLIAKVKGGVDLALTIKFCHLTSRLWDRC